MHHRERFLTSNTACLANRLLENCHIYLRGHKDIDFNFQLDESYNHVYLYPHENAIDIDLFLQEQSSSNKPYQLIVPDGSWRQAKKMYKRIPILKGVPCVKIPFTSKSIYQLRTQKYEESLCTIEAIAKALGIIESKELENHLMKVMSVMNERMINSRSKA